MFGTCSEPNSRHQARKERADSQGAHSQGFGDGRPNMAFVGKWRGRLDCQVLNARSPKTAREATRKVGSKELCARFFGRSQSFVHRTARNLPEKAVFSLGPRLLSVGYEL